MDSLAIAMKAYSKFFLFNDLQLHLVYIAGAKLMYEDDHQENCDDHGSFISANCTKKEGSVVMASNGAKYNVKNILNYFYTF